MSYKTPLAIAVATAALSSTAVAAPSVNFYGFVDIGLATYSADGDGSGLIDPGTGSDTYDAGYGNTDDREFALTNGVQSRLGVKGEEAMEGGWTGKYQMEVRYNTLQSGGQAFRTRLGWLGVSKDNHNIKVGTQWTPFFEYSAWNTHKNDVQGVGSYFYISQYLPGSQQFGYRGGSTINYTYGGGGFSNSPFTGTVALHVADDARTVGGDLVNNSGVTAVSVAGAATFNNVTLNAVAVQQVVKESDAAKAAVTDYSSEVLVYSLGAKYVVNDALDFGFAYRAADRDTKKDSMATSTTVSAQYKLQDNVSLHLGYGVGDDEIDTNNQLDSDIYGGVMYNITDTRLVAFEFEQLQYSAEGKDDVTEQVFQISARQSF